MKKLKKIYTPSKEISGSNILDTLSSNDKTSALSANQGKILNEKFNYSTEETKVGTWIDGKPLYRKVIHINTLPTAGKDVLVNHGISNVDFIFIERAICTEPNGNTSPIPNTWAGTEHTGMYVTKTFIGIFSNADYSARGAYVILNCTKTTD